ncbi:Zinc Finger Protein Gli1 [Manis pentadactyla]|nr:Zinc Finger Protein Gli1 [Manis pentadactyla]
MPGAGGGADGLCGHPEHTAVSGTPQRSGTLLWKLCDILSSVPQDRELFFFTATATSEQALNPSKTSLNTATLPEPKSYFYFLT